ncbi:catecholate siderophore receptor Fiu [Comamonas testosteroni]|uniref:Catecholate siderophore receptor Fiu n=1 Tax=Comamonas testosteroni TaxID=285 RepID=A0A0L7MJU1_COMTE|nr:catecholate siderophore receptor Fiu [Comamonas testosteroni]KOC21813.1 catecholate siderophore receptor Fiu [Comamonas testosteroni]KWT69025.1 Ferrichrome-iron receptor [Comamonas testosteroni]
MAQSNIYIQSRKHSAGRLPSSAGLLACATVLAGATLALPAQAQSAETTLKEVKVEGNADTGYTPGQLSSPKFTQPLVNTTQTVNIIKEQLLQEQGATTLTEALRNVPGAGTFYAGENGNTSTGDAVYMRGFDSSSSIYVDGVRDIGSISRDMFNIDQVEVTKGPAGTDYGRSAPTGAINLVSKQANLNNSFGGSLGLGSASYKRASIDLNRVINAETGTAVRLNAMAQDANVAGRNGIENDRWGIAPSFAFGLNSPTRVFVNLLHIKQSNVPDGGVLTMGLPGYTSPDPAKRGYLSGAARVNSKNFYGTASDHDDVTATMATLKVEHDFSATTKLRNTTRWGETKQDYLLTAFMAGSTQLITPNANDPSTWTMSRNINTKDQVNRILTNQTNLSTSLVAGSVQHDLSLGLELTREEQTNYGLATKGTVPAVSVYNPDSSILLPDYQRNGADSKGKTDTVALYAFDTLKFNDQWQANLGLRLDRYKTSYNAMAVCTATSTTQPCGSNPVGTVVPTTSDGLSKSGTLLSWKAGLLYKPAPNGSVYLNYALSQQPPGGSNFALSAAVNNAANPNMDPQKAKTLELGSKWELAEKNLMLSGALFRTEVTNEIVTNSDGTVGQTGKKIVQGLELGVIGQINKAWGVSAGYTVQNTKVDTGALVAADASNGLTYTPKNAFSLWSTYQLPFGLTIGGGARYAGGLKRGTDGAVGTPNHTDSYWVFDAMASYRVNKNLDIQLNVFNLFDKDYVAAINKSGYRYFPGIARSARLTANFKF